MPLRLTNLGREIRDYCILLLTEIYITDSFKVNFMAAMYVKLAVC